MNITIETKSGQKYLLKSEELVEGFREWLVDSSGADHFKLFLETYEKEPDECPNCERTDCICDYKLADAEITGEDL